MKARSSRELYTYLCMQKCPGCGVAADASGLRPSVSIEGDVKQTTFAGRCSGCSRKLEYVVLAPRKWPRVRSLTALGGDEPSTIIDPGQFLAFAEEHAAQVEETPEALTRERFFDSDQHIREAVAVLEEVPKFIPDGAAAVPESAFFSDASKQDFRTHPEHYTAGALEARLAELRALLARYDALVQELNARDGPDEQAPPPPATVTKVGLRAHGQWLDAGKVGAGRLELVGADLTGQRLSAHELSGALFADCTLDGADLSFSRLIEGTLTRCSAARAGLSSSTLDRATLRDCRFEGTDLRLAHLRGTRIEGGVFRGIAADRGLWNGVTAVGVDFREAFFGDTVLDDACFEDCDFRRADLRRVDPSLVRLGSTTNARFVRCDLRGCKLDGRNMSAASLDECTLDTE